jgi:hypothetical protein
VRRCFGLGVVSRRTASTTGGRRPKSSGTELARRRDVRGSPAHWRAYRMPAAVWVGPTNPARWALTVVHAGVCLSAQDILGADAAAVLVYGAVTAVAAVDVATGEAGGRSASPAIAADH